MVLEKVQCLFPFMDTIVSRFWCHKWRYSFEQERNTIINIVDIHSLKFQTLDKQRYNTHENTEILHTTDTHYTKSYLLT